MSQSLTLRYVSSVQRPGSRWYYFRLTQGRTTWLNDIRESTSQLTVNRLQTWGVKATCPLEKKTSAHESCPGQHQTVTTSLTHVMSADGLLGGGGGGERIKIVQSTLTALIAAAPAAAGMWEVVTAKRKDEELGCYSLAVFSAEVAGWMWMCVCCRKALWTLTFGGFMMGHF